MFVFSLIAEDYNNLSLWEKTQDGRNKSMHTQGIEENEMVLVD